MTFVPPSYAAYFDRDPAILGVWLLEGLRRAIGRFTEAAQPTAHPLNTFIPLFESLNWIATIDDRIGKPRDDPKLNGVRFVRNVVHHEWADALQFVPGAELGVVMPGVSQLGAPSKWVWRRAPDLPGRRVGRHGREEYESELQDRDVTETLLSVLQALATRLPLPDGTLVADRQGD